MNKENCALKLVDEIILYYDARSKKHQIFLYTEQECWWLLQKAETSEGQRNNKASERALAVRNGRIKLNEVRKRERKKEER